MKEMSAPKSVICVIAERCSGCRRCEIACSMGHCGIPTPERSRIRILPLAQASGFVPVLCQACEDAPCIKICPMNARLRTAAGAVVTDEEVCIGCRACLYICPYGAPTVSPDDGKTLTCDRCAGEPEGPWCVAACRDCGALEALPPEELFPRSSRAAARAVRHVLSPPRSRRCAS